MAINSSNKYEFSCFEMEYIVPEIHIVIYQENFIASEKCLLSTEGEAQRWESLDAASRLKKSGWRIVQ